MTIIAGIQVYHQVYKQVEVSKEMKKIISLLVALLTLAACSDTLNEGSSPSNKNGVEDGGITLTINLPDFSKEELTRAGDTGLKSLNVVAYDNDKNCLLNQKITSWAVLLLMVIK